MFGRGSSLIAAVMVAATLVGSESAVAEVIVFKVTNASTMQMSGTVLGTPLVAASGSSDWASGLTGSLDVLVDDFDDPTQLTVISGALDITTNIPDGPFLPGEGGTNTPADADFAFTASSVVQMAIRSLLLNLSSGGPLTLSGSADAASFRADLIGCSAAGGFSDVYGYSPSLDGTRIGLAGMTAQATGEETGILSTRGDVCSLTFVYDRTMDLSSQIPGTVLTISGTMVAERVADVPEPATMTILVSGAMGLLFCAWRRASRLR